MLKRIQKSIGIQICCQILNWNKFVSPNCLSFFETIQVVSKISKCKNVIKKIVSSCFLSDFFNWKPFPTILYFFQKFDEIDIFLPEKNLQFAFRVKNYEHTKFALQEIKVTLN